MTGRRCISALGLACLMAVTLAGTALGKDRERNSYDDSGTDTTCDKYDVAFHVWGNFRIQESTAKLNFQFFYYSEHYNGTTVISNPDNGKWFTEAWSGFFKEKQAKQYGDDPNIFEYLTSDVGKYEVRNSKGKVAFRDRGRIVAWHLFDSEGDFAPGGIGLDYKELSNTWDPDFDFCQLADKLIGSED